MDRGTRIALAVFGVLLVYPFFPVLDIVVEKTTDQALRNYFYLYNYAARRHT